MKTLPASWTRSGLGTVGTGWLFRRWLFRNGAWILVGLLVLAARSSLADHYVVPSGSMQPTLLPGDRVLVDKRAYGLRLPFSDIELSSGDSPRRGDVVIFDSPEDGRRLIKRVVALPGDRLALQEGRLRVNGRDLAGTESDLEWHGEHPVRLDLRWGGGPDLVLGVVPPGRVIVLGDARGNSRDSRFFGSVEVDSIYARARHVYFRSGAGFVWRPLSPQS